MRFLVALFLAGCGTSTSGPDGSAPNDSGPDNWHACTAAIDAGSCGSNTPPCPQTFDGGCPCTGCDIRVGTCGNYLFWSSSGTDTSITYYYDPVTGQLVAGVNSVIPSGEYCVGGPSNFVLPSSCTVKVCTDGG